MPYCVPHETGGGPCDEKKWPIPTVASTLWVNSGKKGESNDILQLQWHRTEDLIGIAALARNFVKSTRFAFGDVNVDEYRIIIKTPPYYAIASATDYATIQADMAKITKELLPQLESINDPEAKMEHLLRLVTVEFLKDIKEDEYMGTVEETDNEDDKSTPSTTTSSTNNNNNNNNNNKGNTFAEELEILEKGERDHDLNIVTLKMQEFEKKISYIGTGGILDGWNHRSPAAVLLQIAREKCNRMGREAHIIIRQLQRESRMWRKRAEAAEQQVADLQDASRNSSDGRSNITARTNISNNNRASISVSAPSTSSGDSEGLVVSSSAPPPPGPPPPPAPGGAPSIHVPRPAIVRGSNSRSSASERVAEKRSKQATGASHIFMSEVRKKTMLKRLALSGKLNYVDEVKAEFPKSTSQDKLHQKLIMLGKPALDYDEGVLVLALSRLEGTDDDEHH